MATKTAAKTGRKSTTKRAAGKAEVAALPRSANQIADAFLARMKTNPGLLEQVVALVKSRRHVSAPSALRAAQVVTRETPATH